MKYCPRCEQTKPYSQFNRNSHKKDNCQSMCRDCQNVRDIGDYYVKPGRKEAIRRQARVNKDIYRDWYITLKDMQPCTDCKVPYPWYVMQFDHLGIDKEFHVSLAVRDRVAKDRILAEIAKCELVCANCHAIRTHKRVRAAWVTIPSVATV